MSSNNNQTPTSVINIATWALAVAFLVITGTLCAIVIRDGNSALVSQAMGELVWLGGVSFAALVGLLGFTKYLENSASTSSTASSASSAPAGNTPSSNPLGVAAGDLGNILSAIGASQNIAVTTAAPAAVSVPVTVTSSAPAGSTTAQ